MRWEMQSYSKSGFLPMAVVLAGGVLLVSSALNASGAPMHGESTPTATATMAPAATTRIDPGGGEAFEKFRSELGTHMAGNPTRTPADLKATQVARDAAVVPARQSRPSPGFQPREEAPLVLQGKRPF